MEDLFGSDGNFRFNTDVIRGAIGPVPLIRPHRLKDFLKTCEAVDTPDQSTSRTKDASTRPGRCVCVCQTAIWFKVTLVPAFLNY